MAFISNDPLAVDPGRRERAARSGKTRGRRFRMVLLGAAALTVPAILLQNWFQNWWASLGGEEQEEIRAASGQPPPFRFREPEREQQKAEMPPPAMPAEPPLKPMGPKKDKRPTQLAFQVAMQGQEPDQSWFADGRRPRLAHGCALRPGASIIRAALDTVIESEVAGQAIATVTEDVMDADGVGRLLIPQGTKLVGAYKANGGLEFQRLRLDFVWNELTMPDGTQLNLGEAAGMDTAGSVGVGGQVNPRWGQLVATAALVSVFDGIQRGGVSDDPGMLGAFQNSASSTTGKLGKDITGRVLDWEPLIRIDAGTRIIVSPRKTVQVC